MRILLTAIILFLGVFQSNAQTLTNDDFYSLIPALEKEDWKTAFDQSSKLLRSGKGDSSDSHAKILYVNIFSAAGLVTLGKMSYGTLTKTVMKYHGSKVIMPFHPLSNDIPLGATSLTVNDSVNEAFTSASNANGTSILCFETFSVKDKIDTLNFTEGILVQCGGTLANIETNSNRSAIWVLRLTVNNAFIRKDD
jgi:hypothetical protein